MSSWIDWVCPSALFVAFLAAVPWGRKPWWLVDAATNLTFGVGLLLIPRYIMGFQIVGKMDDLHMHLCRIIGVVMIGSAVSWYLCRNSVDYRMLGSQLCSRIVTCTFLLIAQLYSAYHLWNRTGQRFNDKYLAFSCVGVFFWLVGSLVQLIRYKEFGGYIHKINSIHVGLLVDSYMLLVTSVVYFAFPSQSLKMMVDTQFKIDGVHVCMLRTLAALLLGQSLVSNYCLGFLYMEDKQAHIAGRLTIQALAFVVSFITFLSQNLFTSYHIIPFVMSLGYVAFLSAVYYAARQKEKEN